MDTASGRKTLLNGIGRTVLLPLLTLLVVAAGCGTDRPESQSNLTIPPVLGAHLCNKTGDCGKLRFENRRFLSATWLDEERMYLSTAAGHIELLDLTTGELERVAGGLSHPRGLVVLHGRLFVSHAGDSCENWTALADEMEGDDMIAGTLRQCHPRGFKEDEDTEVLRKILAASDGRVSSFLIKSGGGLGDRTDVIDSVPTIAGLHGHNGLAVDFQGL